MQRGGEGHGTGRSRNRKSFSNVQRMRPYVQPKAAAKHCVCSMCRVCSGVGCGPVGIFGSVEPLVPWWAKEVLT